jgi:hypothetical protein
MAKRVPVTEDFIADCNSRLRALRLGTAKLAAAAERMDPSRLGKILNGKLPRVYDYVLDQIERGGNAG